MLQVIVKEYPHPKSGEKISGTMLRIGERIQKGDMYTGVGRNWVPVTIYGAILCDKTDAVWVRPFAPQAKK